MSEHLLFPSMYESFSLESLQSPDRSITLRAAIVHYQKEKKKKKRSKGFVLSKTISSLYCILQVSGMGVQQNSNSPDYLFFFFFSLPE